MTCIISDARCRDFTMSRRYHDTSSPSTLEQRMPSAALKMKKHFPLEVKAKEIYPNPYIRKKRGGKGDLASLCVRAFPR